MKFKAGQRVIVARCTNSHQYKLGTVVVLWKAYNINYSGHWVTKERPDSPYVLHERDLDLVALVPDEDCLF